MDVMGIASASVVMKQSEALNDVSLGVLSMAMDTAEGAGAEMIKSLESLASPATMGTVVDTIA